MLLLKNKMNCNELNLLMEIYEESNIENITYMFPECKNTAEGLEKVKNGYCRYITDEFLCDSENTYCIWVEDNQWVSALRLYKFKDCYFIEALETKPSQRKKGYGVKLMNSVISYLKAQGRFILRDHVCKGNAASLALHKKCGFEIEFENAVSFFPETINKTDTESYGMIYICDK